MGKWLALASVIVVAALALLWWQIRTPDAAPAAPARAKFLDQAPVETAEIKPVAAPAPVAAEPTPSDKPKKLDPQSDAFFNRFDEAVPRALTRAAAECYTGGLERVHRNQKLTLNFKVRIRDGQVTVHDIAIKDNTLNNTKLEQCFIGKVAAATWRDDELPDWDQDDTLVIRPERGMKKFTKENMDYDGSGPIGEAVPALTPEQIKAIEDSHRAPPPEQ